MKKHYYLSKIMTASLLTITICCSCKKTESPPLTPTISNGQSLKSEIIGDWSIIKTKTTRYDSKGSILSSDSTNSALANKKTLSFDDKLIKLDDSSYEYSIISLKNEVFLKYYTSSILHNYKVVKINKETISLEDLETNLETRTIYSAYLKKAK
ncbi:hypothetical protein [Pedobacter cryoconitis]|uniref:Lipocalin-like domain-containing protein n=1 Tax=Pedobacter cryoconitis TaxID=188932 RepID=A0A7X0J5N2_9SPHI|nr:hypothetical protein [Pedobacter cryoconitis]MBB6500812.1 hypothetical protein [Pedobacter cryoconitis]